MLLFLISLMIPSRESFVYQTDEKGKLGTIDVTLNKDTAGYRIHYVSDRVIDVILDSTDLRTLYVNKSVKGKWELSIEQQKKFMVNFKGRKASYDENGPVYDRHTLDNALRVFDYDEKFKRRLRLNVPEFMVINADLSVVGSETVNAPVGNIECWKILMEPRVLIIKRKFYFWIEKEFPHRCVKYTDSSGNNLILLIKYTGQYQD
jgi:hypothetical protein